MTLILDNDDVRATLTMADCIAALEDAYLELAEARGAFRRRSDIVVPAMNDPEGYYVLKSMDGVVPKLGVGAIRLNSDILTYRRDYGNLRRVKLAAAPGERYVGLVLLFSTATGEPLAIFPDGVIQPMRVAATTALGAKYLARNDARSVAVIGSGWQARHQLQAIAEVRDIREIRCYSTNKDHREAFCEEMGPVLQLEVQPADTPEQAVEHADIVLCATNSLDQVVKPGWLRPGMHMSSIKPAEITADVAALADIVVVHVNDCDPEIVTTHGITIPEQPSEGSQNLGAELGFSGLPTLPDMIAGRAQGRTDDAQVTCFLNTMGLGYQFAAAGAVLYRKAKAAGKGRDLPTDWFTEKEIP